MDIPLYATTDAQGCFEFFAAPGRYLVGPGTVYLNRLLKAENVKTLFVEGANEFQIKDQPEIEINLHCERLSAPRKSRSK
jgi:hypothetical protein